MENNSSKIVSDSVDVDRSMLKIAVLAVFSVVSLSAFGYFFKLFFQGGKENFLLISGLSAIVFLIFFTLQTLFIKSLKINSLIIFLSCVGLAAIFYDIANFAILTGIVLVFLALFFGNINGVRELRNSLKINFWKINKTVLPKAVAAIFLFISIIYIYGNSAVNGEFFISQRNFEKIVLSPSIIIAQRFYPEINTSLTINELAVNLAKKQIEESSELNVLPSTVKKTMVNQAAAELEKQIGGFLNIPESAGKKSTISETLYETLKNKFNAFPENIKSLILIGVVLAIFLTLEVLALPIRLIISSLTFIVYEILLAFGFANVELEGRSKEIIILK